MRIIFKILNFSVWIFLLGLFILLLTNIIYIGDFPDLKHMEYNGPSILRWIVIGLMYWAALAIFIGLILYSYLSISKSKHLKDTNFGIYFTGIFLYTFIIFLNPYNLFTWFMG